MAKTISRFILIFIAISLITIGNINENYLMTGGGWFLISVILSCEYVDRKIKLALQERG